MAGNLRTVANPASPEITALAKMSESVQTVSPIGWCRYLLVVIFQSSGPTPFVVLISRQGDGSGVLPSGEMS